MTAVENRHEFPGPLAGRGEGLCLGMAPVWVGLLAAGLLCTGLFWAVPALGQEPGDGTTHVVLSSISPCLNVRQHPSTAAVVVDCLPPGSPVTRLHSTNGWVKVRLESNSQGWVAASFLMKRPQARASASETTSVSVPPAASLRTVAAPALEPRTVEPRTVEPRTVEPRTVEPRTVEPRLVEDLLAEQDSARAEAEPASDSEVEALADVTVADTVSPCLNLRRQPGAGSPVVDCLKPGTSLTAVRGVPGWKNVLTPDGLQGWVAEEYLISSPSGRASRPSVPSTPASNRPLAPEEAAPSPVPVASATSSQEIALLEEVDGLRADQVRLEATSRDLRGSLQQVRAELARSELARSELQERLQAAVSRDAETEALRRELIEAQAARSEAQEAVEVWRRQAERSTTAQAAAEERRSALQNDLTKAQAELNRVQAEVGSMRGELAKVRSEAKASASREAALEWQVAGLGEALTDTRRETQALLASKVDEEETRRAPLLEVLEPLPDNTEQEALPGEVAVSEAPAEMPSSDVPSSDVPSSDVPSSDLPDVEAAVEHVLAWAEAWSRQDVAAYLGSYARRFSPADGTSRGDWAASRRRRVAAPKSIQVTLREVQASLPSENRAQVRFSQTYRSDNFQDVVRKILVLAREDGAWRILEELVDEAEGP